MKVWCIHRFAGETILVKLPWSCRNYPTVLCWSFFRVRCVQQLVERKGN